MQDGVRCVISERHDGCWRSSGYGRYRWWGVEWPAGPVEVATAASTRENGGLAVR